MPPLAALLERVRPMLRGWEIQTGLKYGRDALRFEFDSSEVKDRNPPPPGSTTVHPFSAAVACMVAVTVECHVERNEYPTPPSAFQVTPLVELLWNRFQQYVDGKDMLATMGYACLSAIQTEAGGRNKASNQYKIDREVLDKLGELTSDVGDELTARKFDAKSSKRAHTPGEQNWIVELVKVLIARVAEYEHDQGAPLKQIAMANLPKL